MQHQDMSKSQTMAIDIWALGLIYYKMLVGRVAFPGVNQFILFQDIQNRKINWPSDEELPKLMDPSAKDLVEKMLQTDPSLRIGIKDIKKHPYFIGLDFNLVSMPDYQGARIMVEETLERIK